jgi:phosphatidylserine/phosphatidylglycerophosphate/cardiolipin synthase-like enzyme
MLAPSLAELRDRWFLDFEAGPGGLLPIRRHAGSEVKPFTDGNHVRPLLDGQAYMRVWSDAIEMMSGHQGAEIYHAGWRMDDVRPLGEDPPSPRAVDVLVAAAAAGVTVRLALSRHGFGTASILNRAVSLYLLAQGVRSACLDNRYPVGGSNHPKAVCLKDPAAPQAILGSIDISASRWDTPEHKPVDKRREPRWGKPTHDTGVSIRGPAVGDIERTFIERWNDPTRRLGLEPIEVPQSLITTPPSDPAPEGTQSVQVLHTYGVTSRFYGYSWSPAGEFTVWAAYLNAIRKASTSIYIEDQYFLPFDSPPRFAGPGMGRDTDIVYQLGEAVKRGVRVAVLTPSNAEDAVHRYIKHQRDLGVMYLTDLTVGNPGRFVCASLAVGPDPVYVHSKLLIVDDEYVLIGSANVGQRSMTYDSELSVGVVDEADQFAKELRTALWAEHLQRPADSLTDQAAAYDVFLADTWAGNGRVRLYNPDAANDPPDGHSIAMRTIVDPYAGPIRDVGS